MDAEVDDILALAEELKRPLATMRQLAFAFDGAGEMDERVRTEMVSVSDRAIRQVNDLLKMKRLEDGLFVMEPVAVRGVCDEVTTELIRLFNYNRRDLFVKYQNRARLVTANRELLKSVVYNFLLSAVHYANDGERAELIVRDAREKVQVIVRDFGPALPMDVWREMRRGWLMKPKSIAMRPGTSGLGLYIASKFSQYMNAGVGAVRHRDGTSFYVELPVSRQMSLLEM
ncbi:HAMP domain-containing histidine kinase [Candidatus Saccharibacteria bacterium]|nr:HAMP domain-containing histidine kinase [Candidatus Saccharibacteria bacterium]